MLWIYLSPHFDDVALSCGGLVWEQARQGNQVSIWTICAGEPPAGDISPFALSLHERWNFDLNAPAQRRQEDLRSCQRLGAGQWYFPFPDCIYRRDPQTHEHMYTSEASLNGSLQPGDEQVMAGVQDELKMVLPPEAILVCPLALGNHVDHQLTRSAAEGLEQLAWYYADFPYVTRDSTQLDQLMRDGWQSQVFAISMDGLEAWIDSVGAHASQISTFWSDEPVMRQAISDYWHSIGGIRLWKKPTG